LKESVYGGRLDNEFDQKVLSSIIQHLLTAKSFDVGFLLVSGVRESQIPDQTKFEQFLGWAHQLPENVSAPWLYLPIDIESVMMLRGSQLLTDKLHRIHQNLLAEEQVVVTQQKEELSAENAGLRLLKQMVPGLLKQLPASCLKLNEKASGDPVGRVLAREAQTAVDLLDMIRSDLEDLQDMLLGQLKWTNRNHQISHALIHGTLSMIF
jgi:dynein heavy chain 1